MSDAGSLRVETRSVNDKSWADVWKKYFKPFYAGQHLVVKPTWEPFDPKPGDKVIEIDPGMAFGSVTHETTGMCLSILEENIRGGEEIIDVGTGQEAVSLPLAPLCSVPVMYWRWISILMLSKSQVKM